jgi:putative Holliday junction resolvase
VSSDDAVPRAGRLLGLDAGERRVGVAISDPEQSLAVPLRTLERSVAARELELLARDEEVAGVVIGLPLSLSGESGEQAERTREFARGLSERLNLPVAFWDERLSSQEAERILAPSRPPGRSSRTDSRARRPDKGATDQVAATIILQAFLDSRRGSVQDWAAPLDIPAPDEGRRGGERRGRRHAP